MKKKFVFGVDNLWCFDVVDFRYLCVCLEDDAKLGQWLKLRVGGIWWFDNNEECNLSIMSYWEKYISVTVSAVMKVCQQMNCAQNDVCHVPEKK